MFSSFRLDRVRINVGSSPRLRLGLLKREGRRGLDQEDRIEKVRFRRRVAAGSMSRCFDVAENRINPCNEVNIRRGHHGVHPRALLNKRSVAVVAVTKTAAMSALRKLRSRAFIHILALAAAITCPNNDDALLQ
jgi:hypothetical protein